MGNMNSQFPQLFRRLQPSWQLLPMVVLAAWAATATGQPPANQPAGNLQNVFAAPNGQPQNNVLNGPFAAPNANNAVQRGGAQNADFESLMDLIVSTVHPELWTDNGGVGDLRPFYGGVLVDTAGTLRVREHSHAARSLIEKRGTAPSQLAKAQPGSIKTPSDERKECALRFVSLPRLEREIARRQAASEPLDPAMLTLAGLQRVQYVFVYPETGDLVLAGPAGDWKVNGEGRLVSARTELPIIRLDDFLVLLRRGEDAAGSHFGCSINPRQDALAKTQAFLASSSQKPLAPGGRKKWLRELRDSVGVQDIEIFGVDPTSHVASVLVEADYHMKLVGMGLAEGVDGVESYLNSVEAAMKRTGASASPMSVLRWWFALNYDAVNSSPDKTAFELIGQGVQVLSENEMLAAQGQRVHTGNSEPLNRQFAGSFTKHFTELAAKYPVYGELRNIFDLAMAVALIQSEGLAERAHWKPSLFASDKELKLPQAAAPRQVETVVNHRMVNRTQIVAGVSGGVMVAPTDVLRENRGSADSAIAEIRDALRPADNATDWWWDE